jgi:hypothetical protein
VHGSNTYASLSFEKRLDLDLRGFDVRSAAMARICHEMGFEVDPDEWKRKSWWTQVRSVVEEIKRHIPLGEQFVLIDSNQWGLVASEEQRPVPFLEYDPEYSGPPPSDAAAIAELERLRELGCKHLVIGWPASWLLDYYPNFAAYLTSSFAEVVADDRLILFNLTLAPSDTARVTQVLA